MKASAESGRESDAENGDDRLVPGRGRTIQWLRSKRKRPDNPLLTAFADKIRLKGSG